MTQGDEIPPRIPLRSRVSDPFLGVVGIVLFIIGIPLGWLVHAGGNSALVSFSAVLFVSSIGFAIVRSSLVELVISPDTLIVVDRWSGRVRSTIAPADISVSLTAVPVMHSNMYMLILEAKGGIRYSAYATPRFASWLEKNGSIVPNFPGWSCGDSRFDDYWDGFTGFAPYTAASR